MMVGIIERLRHENDCLQARVAQIDYPCSPHCDGYLRELKQRRVIEYLLETLDSIAKAPGTMEPYAFEVFAGDKARAAIAKVKGDA